MRTAQIASFILSLLLLSACASKATDVSVVQYPENDLARMQAAAELVGVLYDLTHDMSIQMRDAVLRSMNTPQAQQQEIERRMAPYLTREYHRNDLQVRFASIFSPEESRVMARLMPLAFKLLKEQPLSASEEDELQTISSGPLSASLQWKMQMAQEIIKGHYQRITQALIENMQADQQGEAL